MLSDSPPHAHGSSNSKSNLIDVQHVGVTAKIQSPLKNLLPDNSSSSSMETDSDRKARPSHCRQNSRYEKFVNDPLVDSTDTTTESSKVLYEMRAKRKKCLPRTFIGKATPSKIEFQLYNKPVKKRLRCMRCYGGKSKMHKGRNNNNKKFPDKRSNARQKNVIAEKSFIERLREYLDNMCRPNTQRAPRNIFDNPLDSTTKKTDSPSTDARIDIGIGVYPFEHGCAEHLRTTDTHPSIVSHIWAERATHYATRFWAELFGSLHIGVTFVVTFILQTYRFILYSLINTLLVGLLHMTSDYLIKPLLTAIFNGFLQPPLILIYNILTSIRDILEPVADTLNNFMKPVATVFDSFRLINVSHSKRKTVKSV